MLVECPRTSCRRPGASPIVVLPHEDPALSAGSCCSLRCDNPFRSHLVKFELSELELELLLEMTGGSTSSCLRFRAEAVGFLAFGSGSSLASTNPLFPLGPSVNDPGSTGMPDVRQCDDTSSCDAGLKE